MTDHSDVSNELDIYDIIDEIKADLDNIEDQDTLDEDLTKKIIDQVSKDLNYPLSKDKKDMLVELFYNYEPGEDGKIQNRRYYAMNLHLDALNGEFDSFNTTLRSKDKSITDIDENKLEPYEKTLYSTLMFLMARFDREGESQWVSIINHPEDYSAENMRSDDFNLILSIIGKYPFPEDEVMREFEEKMYYRLIHPLSKNKIVSPKRRNSNIVHFGYNVNPNSPTNR